MGTAFPQVARQRGAIPRPNASGRCETERAVASDSISVHRKRVGKEVSSTLMWGICGFYTGNGAYPLAAPVDEFIFTSQ